MLFKSKKAVRFAARIALLLTAIFWGSSLVVVKNVAIAFSPNLLLAIRFTVAFAILSLIFYKKYKLMTKEYFKSGIIIGFCLFLAYCIQTIGVTIAMPGKSGFLSSVYCVIVPFLSWLIQKKRPDKYNISAALICGIGVICCSVTSDFSIAFGDLLALLSGIFFALHIVAIAKWGEGKDPILITILQFGVAAVFSWISFLFVEKNPIANFSDIKALLGLFYLAIACTAIALLLQNIGQKHSDPTSASIILSLESIFGVIFSVIFFNEKINTKLIFGFALIFISIIISETKLNFLTKYAKKRSSDLQKDNNVTF